MVYLSTRYDLSYPIVILVYIINYTRAFFLAFTTTPISAALRLCEAKFLFVCGNHEYEKCFQAYVQTENLLCAMLRI